MLYLLFLGVTASVMLVYGATSSIAPAARALALLGAASFGTLAAIAVAYAIDRIVLRRVQAMLAATERLRAGDLGARTGVPYGRSEVGALAREFDGMAADLQRQHVERLGAVEQLRLSEARKSAVLEASLDGILVLDGTGAVVECNAAARALFACAAGRRLSGRLCEMFPGEPAFDAMRFNRPAEVLETTGHRLDESEFPAEISIAPIRDAAAHGLFVATVRDITARKQLERSLESLSFEDELTGTYNRRGFLMFASQQIKMAARNGQSVVIVSVDLDGLKRINDHFGHANGDHALVEVAAALRASFRKTDVIGRLGGDEFVVLAPETEQTGAEHALERFAMRIANRNATGELPWTLSASMGWLRADPSQGVSLSDLLARVDERMYAHKRREPSRVKPWQPSLEPEPRLSPFDPGERATRRAAAEPTREAASSRDRV